MTTLSAAYVLALAMSCQNVVAPTTILRIAQHESGLDPAAVHINRDASRDRGLMQINEANDAWLGLRDPFDPCQSIRAAANLLASYSKYNTGSPTKGIENGYAAAVQAVRVADAEPAPAAPTPAPPPCPADDDDGWHTVARPQGCPDTTATESEHEDK